MVNSVVTTMKKYLFLWKTTQGRSTGALFHPMMEGDEAISWVKPQRNVVKVRVDAAMFEDHDMFGIGILARDYT